jgi:hypothetical protein
MYCVSVDPGYINCGFCCVEIDTNFDIDMDSIYMKKIDLTNLPPCDADCKLPHSCHSVDRIIHFFHIYGSYFDKADIILLEYQCIGSGGTSIENLIYFKYRHKTTLVYPHELHSFYKTRGVGYDVRKDMTVQTVAPYVAHHPKWDTMVRKHDVADAILFVLYYCEMNKKRLEKERPRPVKTVIDFSKFSYKPPISL